jgi:hypothetical protein
MKSMTIRCTPLALFTLLGCSVPVSEPAEAPVLPLDAEIQVSDAFSGEERAEIEGAAADWYRATGGSVRFEFVRRAGDAPWRVERGGDDFCAGHSTWFGCARMLERRIELNPDRITPDDGQPLFATGLRWVVLHEFGHALGLAHGDGAVMEEQMTGDAPCIDAETLSSFCERRGCAEFRPDCPM